LLQELHVYDDCIIYYVVVLSAGSMIGLKFLILSNIFDFK